MFYSPSNRGFYDPAIHGEAMPADVVEITASQYSALLAAQSSGQIIQADSGGYPEAVDTVPNIQEIRSQMKVTTFQAHAAINRSGLYNAVTELMNDPATDFEVKLAWDKAQHFSRLSPAVLAMGAALGLTDQQLDDLFALAATIEA